ncbi:(2Fe-2S)-binding protein [Streptomyces sp. NPDC004065]|uniref:(2Fe-2S)-binding protein n=1 Tax=Streptomyces sp. NPDC004065 TaxID=3364689 RepID=UPI00384ABE3E
MVLLLFVDLDPALAALRPLGGFFVLRTGAPPRGPLPTLARAYGTSPPAQAAAPSSPAPSSAAPPSGAARAGSDDDPLAVRVRRVAAALRVPETRVAASVAHQALAARLWSAALGCAVRYGRIPDLDPCLLHWDPAGSAPDDLWLTEVRPLPGDAATLADVVLRGHLEPLAAALRARHRLAPGLLWGNAASALAGAARQVEGWARAGGDGGAGDRARELTARLLAHPLLTGTLTATGPLTGPGAHTGTSVAGTRTLTGPGAHTGTSVAGTGTPSPLPGTPSPLPGTPGTVFRRRSCCLYYRVPGGGICGDCCFTRAPRSSPRAASG